MSKLLTDYINNEKSKNTILISKNNCTYNFSTRGKQGVLIQTESEFKADLIFSIKYFLNYVWLNFPALRNALVVVVSKRSL